MKIAPTVNGRSLSCAKSIYDIPTYASSVTEGIRQHLPASGSVCSWFTITARCGHSHAFTMHTNTAWLWCCNSGGMFHKFYSRRFSANTALCDLWNKCTVSVIVFLDHFYQLYYSSVVNRCQSLFKVIYNFIILLTLFTICHYCSFHDQ